MDDKKINELCSLVARLADTSEAIARRLGADELELGRIHNIRVDALSLMESKARRFL